MLIWVTNTVRVHNAQRGAPNDVTNKETSGRKHHVDCFRTRYGRTPKAAGPFGSVGVVTGESFTWTTEGNVAVTRYRGRVSSTMMNAIETYKVEEVAFLVLLMRLLATALAQLPFIFCNKWAWWRTINHCFQKLFPNR